MSKIDDADSGPEIDRIIHEPARLRIMAQLYVVDSADFIFLMTQLGMTWGNLSSHMTKLEDAEYIEVQKEFLNKKPRTILKLTQKGRKAFIKYRKTMDQVFKGIPD